MGGAEAAKAGKVTPFPKDDKAADGGVHKAHSEGVK
jgi:hypothetical protein